MKETTIFGGLRSFKGNFKLTMKFEKGYQHSVECKQYCPGFELVSQYPFSYDGNHYTTNAYIFYLSQERNGISFKINQNENNWIHILGIFSWKYSIEYFIPTSMHFIIAYNKRENDVFIFLSRIWTRVTVSIFLRR